ncbi:MAG: c-type cytochrome [Gammaproteobacteria bacterium]
MIRKSTAALAATLVLANGTGFGGALAMGEERKSPNPLSQDEAAIAEGKTLYRARCALCHGVRANGRGRGLPNSADLRKFKRGYSSFVDTVKNGRKTMPPWGGMGALTESEINQIGAYLETLAVRGANWKDDKQSSLWRGLLRVLIADAAAAQDGYRQHLDNINVEWPNAPGGAGLLAILEQEADIARQHAGLAIEDTENLDNIQLHTRHVRHAVDPAKESSGQGPGKGFGVCPAARALVEHMTLARDAADAPQSVKTHAEHVLASAGNIVTWCGKVLDKAAQILGGASPVASAFFAEETVEHMRWITEGRDANEDGEVSWDAGEGGLAQVKQSLALIEQ